ncbi:MAG: hypothetical protein IJ766_10345 [Clostridia bacterium]|nr:hypothetical protein [Clostridia bacterium]
MKNGRLSATVRFYVVYAVMTCGLFAKSAFAMVAETLSIETSTGISKCVRYRSAVVHKSAEMKRKFADLRLP